MFDHSFQCTAVYKVDVVHLGTITTRALSFGSQYTGVVTLSSILQCFDCLSTAEVFPQAMRSTGCAASFL